MVWRLVRWTLAVVLWLITGVSVLLAGWLFALEGEFFVGCGDDICEGGIPGAIGATVIAVCSLVLGWLLRPRSGTSHQVTRPLALAALATFGLGVALIALQRERWFEDALVGDAFLPVGLAAVGAGILMVAISVGRRPAPEATSARSHE